MIALLAGCVVAFVIALRRQRVLPLAIAAVAAVPALWSALAIYDIEVGARPEPELTGVRLGFTSCPAPCADGFPVRFTVDEEARVQISLSRFGGGIPGAEVVAVGREPVRDDGFSAGYHVEPGKHLFRIARRPGEPGRYSLLLSVEPEHEGNRAVETSGSFNRVVRILPPG